MKKTALMAAVAAIALMTAQPVMADDSTHNSREVGTPTENPNAKPVHLEKELKAGWKDTKQTAAEAVDSFKANFLSGPASAKHEKYESPITIRSNMTAEAMLGKPVVNQAGDRVATMEDIILDKDGAAKLVVVKDGDFMGLGGKLAAFDYADVIKLNKDGDVVMPITEKTIDRVSEFSYKTADAGEKVRVIPANGYSVKKLLDGEITDQNGSKLATIDNVTFVNGNASMIIGSYNQVLNMGGDKVALDFDAGQMVKDGGDIDVKLSAAQSKEFRNFKAVSKK